MSSKTAGLEITTGLEITAGLEVARESSLPTSFDLNDGLKLALVPLLAWLLGRGAQNAKQKIETRNTEQSANKMLWERVGKLEDKVDLHAGKIETLHEDKMRLNAEIIDLKRQIATLQVRKEEYETKEIIHIAQIAALEEKLVAERERLRVAEHRMELLDNTGR